MSAPCREVELWIGRPPSALSEAERLQLEQHLSTCAACSRVRALSRSLTSLVTSAPGTLGAAARERAIAGAFSRVAELPAAPRRTSRAVRAGATLLVAAVALLGLRLAWPERAPSELARSALPHGVAPSKLASVATPSSTLQRPLEPQAPQWIEVADAETRSFAHAQVQLSAGTRVRFDPARTELELTRGRVDVDVDASRGKAFAVVTQRFRVQVLGTLFAVTPERVEVQRGHVQVRASDGSWLASDLGPGQSFVLASARRAAPVRAAAVPRESAAALLQQARAALAQGDAQAARVLVERAEQRPLKRRERAEAGTLRAECALVERRPDQALQAYLAVAERFAGLESGENALFAAAQLSARTPSAAAGTRALLARYLTRYPQGRFAEEVQARLSRLTGH